ncbi:hypothetical protein PAMP_004238 [Pampus punctatissimus]
MQEKNAVFKLDWEAFWMWRDESKKREKQRTQASNSLIPEKSETEPPDTNTLYSCLSEVLRNPVGLDLDSVPPIPPSYVSHSSFYTPVMTHKRAQQRLEEIKEAKGMSPAPGFHTSPAVTMPLIEGQT